MRRIVFSLFLIITLTGCSVEEIVNKKQYKEAYLASNNESVKTYNELSEEIGSKNRGLEILYSDEDCQNQLCEVKIDDKNVFIKEDNIVFSKEEIVKETELFVRTNTVVVDEDGNIVYSIKKGSSIEITGYEGLNAGVVDKYKVKKDDKVGFIYGKYLVENEDLANATFYKEGMTEIHAKRGDTLGGGSAINLDFYPREKPKFANNVMPEEVRALYLNGGNVRNIDEYITFALENNINAFVIDIKDNTSPAYKSPVMEKYSPTNFERGFMSLETYKGLVKKANDAGIYTIGRITVFKDSYLVKDHPEVAIYNKEKQEPLIHNGSKWPSAYNRFVWEFNVALAKEAATEMGFNEIQFDYVRFPDGLIGMERRGEIDLKNEFEEDKAVTIQNFVMYATDQLHDLEVYVSADVFGESAHQYVTAYGQYFGAISNVVDVISPMPYPDHFSKYEYGLKTTVWTVPYEVLNVWGSFASARQKEIPTPAIVRNWLQAYDAIRPPYNSYGPQQIEDQINAFYDNGLTGGYMTWNSSGSLIRYEQYKEIFKKDLIKDES